MRSYSNGFSEALFIAIGQAIDSLTISPESQSELGPKHCCPCQDLGVYSRDKHFDPHPDNVTRSATARVLLLESLALLIV